ncbi:hypothetical protein C8J57DRAFT_1520083 [Mycena rebaudengoi]|nr:hypothetical protein C8J57DRAFT_1520083 [Mycena rebaudengoi]
MNSSCDSEVSTDTAPPMGNAPDSETPPHSISGLVSTDEPDIHEAISPQRRDIAIQWTSHLWLERFAHPAEVFSSDPRRDRGTFISHFASLVIAEAERRGHLHLAEYINNYWAIPLSDTTRPVEDLPSPALAMTDVRRPGY